MPSTSSPHTCSCARSSGTTSARQRLKRAKRGSLPRPLLMPAGAAAGGGAGRGGVGALAPAPQAHAPARRRRPVRAAPSRHERGAGAAPRAWARRKHGAARKHTQLLVVRRAQLLLAQRVERRLDRAEARGRVGRGAHVGVLPLRGRLERGLDRVGGRVGGDPQGLVVVHGARQGAARRGAARAGRARGAAGAAAPRRRAAPRGAAEWLLHRGACDLGRGRPQRAAWGWHSEALRFNFQPIGSSATWLCKRVHIMLRQIRIRLAEGRRGAAHGTRAVALPEARRAAAAPRCTLMARRSARLQWVNASSGGVKWAAGPVDGRSAQGSVARVRLNGVCRWKGCDRVGGARAAARAAHR